MLLQREAITQTGDLQSILTLKPLKLILATTKPSGIIDYNRLWRNGGLWSIHLILQISHPGGSNICNQN